MGQGILTFLAILVVATLLITGIIVAVVYNRLVVLRNRFINALSQIDVQLKRRHDLIPNLVESVRCYLAHERGILEEIARLRAGAEAQLGTNPKSRPTNLIQNDLALSKAVGQLTAVVESYPNLMAVRSIADLMEDITSTENRVGFARQAYNDAVMEYNQTRETFPSVMFASRLGFNEAWFWWSDPVSRTKPVVPHLAVPPKP